MPQQTREEVPLLLVAKSFTWVYLMHEFADEEKLGRGLDRLMDMLRVARTHHNTECAYSPDAQSGAHPP